MVEHAGANDRVIWALIVRVGGDRPRRVEASYNPNQVLADQCAAVIFVVPLFSDLITDASR